MNRRFAATAVLLLSFSCKFAFADAASPLIFAEMYHLLALNALIGALEAAAISWCYGCSRARATPVLTLANYVSAFGGGLVLWLLVAELEARLPGAFALNGLRSLMGAVIGVSWALSVLLEWPFYSWVTQKSALPTVAGLRRSIFGQTVSYCLIVPYYYLFSSLGLVTGIRVVGASDFGSVPPCVIYFIGLRDGAVWEAALNGSGAHKVMVTHANSPYARLSIVDNQATHCAELWLVEPGALPWSEAVCTRLARNVGPWPPNRKTTGSRCRDSWDNVGVAQDFRPGTRHTWNAYTEFSPGGGLVVTRNGDDLYRVAFGMPFIQWSCRNATILPGDNVLFQMGGFDGTDKIVLLRAPTRTLSVVAAGRGPVAIIPGVRSER